MVRGPWFLSAPPLRLRMWIELTHQYTVMARLWGRQALVALPRRRGAVRHSRRRRLGWRDLHQWKTKHPRGRTGDEVLSAMFLLLD
jgi:hypothetical protein